MPLSSKSSESSEEFCKKWEGNPLWILGKGQALTLQIELLNIF